MYKLIYFIKIFLFFIIPFNSLLSQEIGTDTPIYLKEVNVTAKKNTKEVTYRPKGKRNSTISMMPQGVLASLYEDIPKGKLVSITFYFNKKRNIEYTKTEFRLSMYAKDSNNLPGKQLVDKDVRFIVEDTRKQKIELDVSDFYISTHKPLFIGFEKLNNHNDDLGFTIKTIQLKNANIYAKPQSVPEWLMIPNVQFDVKLKIEQEK